MGKLIRGVHHIAIKCADAEKYDETIRFYREVLGMKMIRSWGEGANAGCMLDTGDGRKIELFASGLTDGCTGSVNHFAFDIADTDACIEAVRNAGYKVTDEPHDIVIGSVPPYPARIAFCIGPNGEEIEFFCEK